MKAIRKEHTMKRTSRVLTGSIAVLVLTMTALVWRADAQSKQQQKKANVELPPAVAKAVRDNVPNAEIDIMDVEEEAGIKLYDIEFKAGRGEIEVAEDGTVMDVATIIQMKDVPKPAADAIQKAAAGAKANIKQLEKSEIRAEIQTQGEKGKIVKLAAPKYVYEAELVKGNQTGEIRVAPDGKVVEAIKWEAAGKESEEKPEKPATKKK
jgi:uncharacterized membrane protein YkoI